MANGKIRFGKQSGGQLALVIPDGVDNTEVFFPESGILAKTSDINTAGIELKTIATGTATFIATTNNISLTGIGVGVEIGDVIQISGAEDNKNNSEFTVEAVIDDDNIIVNQAHANKGTSKNVATRASDIGVTVKLLAKWYNAPNGLGQGWVNMTASRNMGVTYLNNIGRSFMVLASSSTAAGTYSVEGTVIANMDIAGTTGASIPVCFIVPKDNTYSISVGAMERWSELR